MTYAQLMAKLKKGEALSEEEMAAFEKESRPAERFNEVSAKAQQYEAELKAKAKEFEELSSKQLDEAQKLQDEVQKQLAALSGKVETLSADNQRLAEQAKAAQRAVKIRDLAHSNPTGAVFGDPEYLGFLLSKQEIDLDNTEQVAEVFKSLKEKHPEQFKTPVNGGSGSGAPNPGSSASLPRKVAYDDIASRVEFLKNGGKPEDISRQFPITTEDT